MKAIFIISALFLAPTSGLPVKYDQRQEGELNVHAHLENFIIVLIPNSGGLHLLDFIPVKKDASHATKPNPNSSDKYLSQGTGTKVSGPDFPAAKSPYKVDLDKSEGEISKVQEEAGDKPTSDEVVISKAPVVLISNSESKLETEPTESTTLNSVDGATTSKSSEEQSSGTEKVEKDDSKSDSMKKENTAERVDANEDKKEELKDETKKNKKEEVKDDINNDKQDKDSDNIPVIDVIPAKPSKSSKSIAFGLEVPRPNLQSVKEDDFPVIDFSPQKKGSRFPEYRHDISLTPAQGKLKGTDLIDVLRVGLDGCRPNEEIGDNGDCQPIRSRQRSGQYFRSAERLLPMLQFGISPADDSV